MLLFVDLLEASVQFEESYDLAADAEVAGSEAACGTKAEWAGQTVAKQLHTFASYQGFLLKIKFDGWKLFCARRGIPPFVHWQSLPGFDRIQRALELAEGVAFSPQEYLRWWNYLQPAGAPEATEVSASPESMADELEQFFQKQVLWWSGKAM